MDKLQELVDAGLSVTIELSGEEAHKYAGKAFSVPFKPDETNIAVVSTGETIEEAIQELHAKYKSEE